MSGNRETPTAARDWTELREGVREVVLTLAATFAFGFAWAAIEMGRLGTEPVEIAASTFETGYDQAAWSGQ